MNAILMCGNLFLGVHEISEFRRTIVLEYSCMVGSPTITAVTDGATTTNFATTSSRRRVSI